MKASRHWKSAAGMLLLIVAIGLGSACSNTNLVHDLVTPECEEGSGEKPVSRAAGCMTAALIDISEQKARERRLDVSTAELPPPEPDPKEGVLHGCKPPPHPNAYPVYLQNSRLEAKVLLAAEMSSTGQIRGFKTIEFQGKEVFVAIARRILAGYYCKDQKVSRQVRFSFVFKMGDGPGLFHYPGADAEVTVSGGRVGSR